MAMATKQADRLEERFRLWDNTSNGYIERADFEREADEIIARLGAQGSPKAQQLKQTYLDMFDQLARVAGTDRMSRADFLRVCEQEIIGKGDEGFATVVRPTIQAIVNVLDRSGDGEISPVEMQAWFAAIGLEGEVADRAFGELDTNGSGKLSVDELVDAVRDYHLGRIDISLLGR
jgi:Ca2+-binding EF-hand superfamily protein